MDLLIFSSKSNFVPKRTVAALFFSMLSGGIYAQTKKTVQDSVKINSLDEVLVTAVRVNQKTPVTFSNLTQKEIATRNLGQDLPILMNFMPSVVTTSDAGNGFGYTGIRVRGSDAARINVTINGIPYNDSESHGTFWVNMPDFASSTQSIQLQRGVGTSTNGSGAFGASLNLLTDTFSEKGSAEISNSIGSFNSRKTTLKFSTGLLNNHFEIAGRLSDMHSDGYVDRAFSNLKSYFLQGTYVGKTTLIKALAFGGKEHTYQSWYGVDQEMLDKNRTYNYAGIMSYDANGNAFFYNNQTDNYQQDHYQLHWNEKVSNSWNTNLALHYTKGKGYYEEYFADQNFTDYGLLPVTIGGTTIDKTNLITQKWLDNDFYGTTFLANYKKGKNEIILGGSANAYNGSHFTQIVWAQYASNSANTDKYNLYYGDKKELNTYGKWNHQFNSKWSSYLDVQFRQINYSANGVMNEKVKQDFKFFNPKAGFTYTINPNSNVYGSYARANREPNRTDFENGTPKPEKLDDFELGWRWNTTKTQINLNGFYMFYTDQLVLTGALDEVGNPIRTNVGKSYRAGIELDVNVNLGKKWIWRPNATLSQNKNQAYIFNNGTTLENLGATNIAYSPNLILGNQLSFSPIANLKLTLLSKYVGMQYLSNVNDSKLDSYTQTDFNVFYELNQVSVFKSIAFSALVNNIFNAKYSSNGVDYGGGAVYYFPQAGTNVLLGVVLKF